MGSPLRFVGVFGRKGGVDEVPECNGDAMTTALNKGRATIAEVRRIQDTLYFWALGEGIGAKAAQKCMNCLDESFFLSLSAPREKHYWPQNPSTKNW